MKIYFRTDASSKIGSGHVMRCLTLAEHLKNNGSEITFISRAFTGNLNALISNKGMRVIELPKPYNNKTKSNKTKSGNYYKWLGASQKQDAKETITVLGHEKPDWLIVDHYALDYDWEIYFSSNVKNIMVIDDLANRPHNCKVLLDQNWFENKDNRYDALVSAECAKLLGPKYALLRPQFSQARKNLKPNIGEVNRIFVFFGGSDYHNLTGMILEAFSKPEFRHLEIDVVIGGSNPRRHKIEKIVKSRAYTHLYIQIDDMASIMKKADLAIGGGGATTWERMCLNLESHVIISSDNQKEVIENLTNNNYLNLIGYADSINLLDFSKYIKKRILKNSILSNSNNIPSLCDGNGVGRVIKAMRSVQEDTYKRYSPGNV